MTTASDLHPDHWLFRISPAGVRPYLSLIRADRPIGFWLLFLPCLWSLSMAPAAASRLPDPWLVLLFALGAIAMRGAGCTVNDIVDRDYDAKVARTAGRPLPSGQVSQRQALMLLVLLLAAGLAVLLCLTPLAIILGVAALAPAAAYPFMKRFTYWPQAFLGIAFNWGALLGWAAAEGTLAWPAVALYLGGVFWTVGYDTLYAHQDREDDLSIGIKSTALMFGRATRRWVAVFYLGALAAWAAAGWLAGLSWPYALGLAAAALQLAWQVRSLDIDDPYGCLLRFKSNKWAGLLLSAGILASASIAS
ncbi:MAG: 4-hydroxybenzoate octaprenyltransferase [Rhodospirillales bacterium]|nr:4-hydroxybenzoate octaprenyltransferase [Rhodospirillales bacterium]